MAGERKYPPSYLSRFVLRARTLGGDPNFISHLVSRRESWNLNNSDFPVHGTEPAPKRMGHVDRLPVPRPLFDALGVDKSDDLHAEFAKHAALTSWSHYTLVIARQFWPEEDFPHALPPSVHPAMPFVALCLMFEPRTVDEASVWQHWVEPYVFRYDPSEPESEPTIAARLAAGKVLAEAMEQAKQESHGLSAQEVCSIESAAAERGEAYRMAIAELDRNESRGGYPMLPRRHLLSL